MATDDNSSALEIGIHVHVYFWIAVFILGVLSLVLAAIFMAGPSPSDSDVLVTLAVPFLLWLALWLSVRRCSSPELSGFRGLLVITAYMTIGIGGMSMLIAIPAVAVAMLYCIVIAVISLFRPDPSFASREFVWLISKYHHHRMYQ